jgi:hypothetical protein
MDTPQAKAKVRARHNQAIREFQRWRKRNPRAKLDRQIQVFDALIDGALPPENEKRKRAATH